MVKKEKRTAAEISRMVQQAIDPMGERGTIRVGPKPAHCLHWMVITSGTASADYLAAAQRKAMELSTLYDMVEDDL